MEAGHARRGGGGIAVRRDVGGLGDLVRDQLRTAHTHLSGWLLVDGKARPPREGLIGGFFQVDLVGHVGERENAGRRVFQF